VEAEAEVEAEVEVELEVEVAVEWRGLDLDPAAIRLGHVEEPEPCARLLRRLARRLDDRLDALLALLRLALLLRRRNLLVNRRDELLAHTASDVLDVRGHGRVILRQARGEAKQRSERGQAAKHVT